MYKNIRPALFRIDPERAHHFTLNALAMAGKLPPIRSVLHTRYATPAQPTKLLGLTFRNRIGLAAGYDKDATAWRGLATLGFGHIEVGTITLCPQAGNPKPRVFRLIKDQAIINRMGFPGKGAKFALKYLQGKRPDNLILGINLGMNKTTSLENAHVDYEQLMTLFHSHADYLTINISSPNTLGLRELQGQAYINQLLARLKTKKESLERTSNRNVPLLIKLSPDLTNEDLEGVLTAIRNNEIDGAIATNTTISRPSLISSNKNEAGGLSGAPLTQLSTNTIAKIREFMGSKFPIIAAGGVMNGEDARQKISAGADLVQLYSGLVYRGPSLVKESIIAIEKD